MMVFITDDEIKKVVQAIKTQIDLADLDKTAVITEVPLSVLTDAVLLINDLTAKINRQQAENQKLRLSRKRLLEYITYLKAVIKQLQKENSNIKADSFREFAEELMKTTILPTRKEIKKLLNKKVGEGNVAKN